MFFAGVHDFGAVWASVRNKAKSVGSLTGDVVSPRARTLFMVVVFFLLMMVNAVFGVAISDAFQETPSSVIPAWTAVVVGHRHRHPDLPHARADPVAHRRRHGHPVRGHLSRRSGTDLVDAGSARPAGGRAVDSPAVPVRRHRVLLPVWLLLQPRDYINGIQLFVGLGLLYGAVLIANPTIVAPAINPNLPASAPPIFPLLFVTIACGAISGFHGLVGSGTTSKQLNKETDARFVGYLGSSGEGSLALVAIIAATAGFATLGDWEAMYSDFGNGGMAAFVQGGARIVTAGSASRTSSQRRS